MSYSGADITASNLDIGGGTNESPNGITIQLAVVPP